MIRLHETALVCLISAMAALPATAQEDQSLVLATDSRDADALENIRTLNDFYSCLPFTNVDALNNNLMTRQALFELASRCLDRIEVEGSGLDLLDDTRGPWESLGRYLVWVSSLSAPSTNGGSRYADNGRSNLFLSYSGMYGQDPEHFGDFPGTGQFFRGDASFGGDLRFGFQAKDAVRFGNTTADLMLFVGHSRTFSNVNRIDNVIGGSDTAYRGNTQIQTTYLGAGLGFQLGEPANGFQQQSSSADFLLGLMIIAIAVGVYNSETSQSGGGFSHKVEGTSYSAIVEYQLPIAGNQNFYWAPGVTYTAYSGNEGPQGGFTGTATIGYRF